jgi:diguanylate cyclase (GGDEF)-like protein
MSEFGSENPEGIDFEKTLDKSVLAEGLVAESAKELATVNHILHQELQSEEPAPAVQIALDRSQAVEEKVNEASAHLSTVNNVLAGELAGRTDLEQKLAAAQADEGAARAAALHDGLTGLPNRTLLDDRLTQGLAHAMRERTTLAVVFIDLDKFKRVNDTYGHAAGDAVLCLIATRLSESTREVDTVSRRGGDEFLLVLSGVGSKDDVARLARNILATIRQPCDLSAFGAPCEVVVSASAGVAVFPKDGSDGATLIEAADAAMYVAKNRGDGLQFAS